jgi:hypothetical protein
LISPNKGLQCSIESCVNDAKCRGMCGKHYTRWFRHQDPTFTHNDMDLTFEERFWSKVNKNGPISEYAPELGECWLWTKALDKNGYGVATIIPTKDRVSKTIGAHRMAYILTYGAAPEEKDLDHLCRTRDCVRPTHLEPVTHRENILRGENFTAKQTRRTNCPNGHPYEGNNLIIDNGGRKCRTCVQERDRLRRPRKSKKITLTTHQITDTI